MEVLILTPGLGDGGAERAAIRMAAALSEAGVRTRIVGLTAEDAFAAHVPGEVSALRLGASRASYSVAKLVRLLRTDPPSVIVSHQMRATRVGLMAHALSRSHARFVAVEHSLARRQLASFPPGLRSVAALLLGRLYRRADAVVAVSRCAAREIERCLGLPDGSVWVIPNIVTDAPTPAASRSVTSDVDPLRLLCVARLVPEKGVDTLLRATAALRGRRSVRLDVAGSGPDRPRLERLSRELDLESEVRFLGTRCDVPVLLRSTDILVLSSRVEALPTVLIEGLMAGVRVVATDVECGPREVLDGGRWGTLVTPDDPEALADGIERELVTDRDRAGLEDHLGRFSAAAVIPEVLRLAGIDGGADETPRGLIAGDSGVESPGYRAGPLSGRTVLLFGPFGPPHGGWSHVTCATRDLLVRRGTRVLTVQSLLTRDPTGGGSLVVKAMRAMSSLLRLRSTLRTSNVDIAILCVGPTNGLARDILAAALLDRRGIPVALRVFGSGLVQWIESWPRPLRRRGFRLVRDAAAVFVESRPLAEDLRELGAHRVRLIPNFVPERSVVSRGEHRPCSEGRELRMVYVGRLHPDKGLGDALEALRQLPPEVNGRLDIVGSPWPGGWSLDEIRRRVRRLPCAAKVHGPLEPSVVYQLLASSDVLLCPTHLFMLEGQPGAVVEAMAHGVVPIVTPLDGLAGLVEHGVTGLVVPPGCSAEIARALILLEGDRGQLLRMSRAAERRVSRFFSETQAAHVLESALAAASVP